MEYREFTCLYCGANGIDRSKTRTRKFCDCYCQQAYLRRKNGAWANTATASCTHNINVLCNVHKCGNCGWNPKVEAKRKEALGCG